MSKKHQQNNPKEVMLEDSLDIASSNIVDWDIIAGKTIFITGATGLIGSTIIRGLLERNKAYNSHIRIIGFVRSIEKARTVFGEYGDNSYLTFIEGGICGNLDIVPEFDFCIHAASETASRNFVEKPVETIETSVFGINNVLKLCKSRKPTSVIFLSSMEVYGTPNEEKLLDESCSEYLNPLSVRSSYPESKRMSENLCISYFSEYNVPCIIARLTQTFGPGISPEDNRVFAQFARCVKNKEDIVLKTKGETKRMYVYTADAAIAILLLLTRGSFGEAYNIANPNTFCSIAEMAEMICRKFGKENIKVSYGCEDTISDAGYNPTQVIKLDVSKIESLGWKALYDLKTMYKRMIKCI